MTESINRCAYEVYLDFLETAEKKRCWNVLDDIPWEAPVEPAKSTEDNAQRVEIYCAEDLYVPDYGAQGLELVRSRFGMAWFHTRWTFEESRYGLAFREYLIRSGLRSEAEVQTLEASVFAKAWKLPFATPRKSYGALQEGATYTAYKLQKDKAQRTGDRVLEAIFHLVGRDEAAHAGFYRAIIGLELS
jgi:acyl-[acyl-carrier-protein] desaturase